MEKTAIDGLYKSFGFVQPSRDNDDELISSSSLWVRSFFNSRRLLLSLEEAETLKSRTSAPCNSSAFFCLLAHVSEELTNTSKPTLEQIARKLRPNHGAGLQASGLTHENRSNDIVQGLIFKAIGWLTMLYEPKVDTVEHNQLLIEPPRDIRGNPVNSQVLGINTNLGAPNERLPVYVLLKHIGVDLMPVPSLVAEHDTYPGVSARPDFFSEQIVVSYLNYATLNKVAKIEVEFVPLLSMHLDFDEQSKKLQVFAFPSWCTLVASAKFPGKSGQPIGAGSSDQVPYLSGLLESYLYGQSINTETVDSQHDEYHVFCREVLLSYSLLCGQNIKASKLFKRDYMRYIDQNRDYRSPLDPLLPELCDKPAKKNPLFPRIGIPCIKEQYSAQKDFRFLGKRLIRLQRFVVEQDPTDWRTLLHDKRDILRFWTFWAVILVGGLSIVLSLVQVGLGVAQVVLAVYQLRQGNGP